MAANLELPLSRPATYLDTSALNALLAEPAPEEVVRAVQAGHDVLVSYHVLTELLDTMGSKRPDRAEHTRKLLDLARTLLEDKELLQHPKVLLERSLELLHKGVDVFPFGFTPGIFAEQLDHDWLVSRSGAEFAASRNWKRQLRSDIKAWRKIGRTKFGLDKHPAAAPPGLEEYLRLVFAEAGNFHQLFADEFRAAGIDPAAHGDLESLARRSQVWYPFLVAEMIARYFTLTAPRYADITDTLHAVYLPCVRCFVTADVAQLQVFQATVNWCYPLQPRTVLSYDEWRRGSLRSAPSIGDPRTKSTKPGLGENSRR